MLQNIGATGSRREETALDLTDAGGAAGARVPAVRIDAQGRAQGAPVRMLAGFAAHGTRAWQWVVMGPEPDPEHAKTFLDSFRLIATDG